MTQLYAKCKTLLTLGVGFCAAVGVLSMAHSGPAQAQSPGVNLAALVAQVGALKTQQTADEAKIASQGVTLAQLQGTPVPGPQGPAGPKGDTGAQGPVGPQGPAGAGAIAALTQTGKDVYFTGVNVHIVDGTGSTHSTSGLGNLTLGYNALGNVNGDLRTGSHNLILGDLNNYSSYGGFVAGDDNTISAPFATVSGGVFNTASGDYSTVSGGSSNTASGGASSVSGGYQNTANYFESSVSGGYQNTASGYIASVSGGIANTASSYYSAVSGGYGNTASGDYSAVSGGYQNTASGQLSSVSGGRSNTAGISFAWVAGSYHSP